MSTNYVLEVGCSCVQVGLLVIAFTLGPKGTGNGEEEILKTAAIAHI